MSEKVNGSYLTREGALTRDASFNVYCSITACRQYEKKKTGTIMTLEALATMIFRKKHIMMLDLYKFSL